MTVHDDPTPSDTGSTPTAPATLPASGLASSPGSSHDEAALPPALAEIVESFADAPRELVLPMLVEFADAVPPLPEELAAHPERMERVVECQTPFFIHASLADDGTVAVAFEAPPEAPTTRAFAGILVEGLAGLTPAEVLAVPDDFFQRMGLAAVISPLRMRGMGAIIARLKRQVTVLAAADAGQAGA